MIASSLSAAAAALPLALLTSAAIVGGGYDLGWRRIPNWLCVATAAAGLVIGQWLGGSGELVSRALHMLLGLGGGMLLFRFGAIGGGDAKFYAAVAAWFALGKALLLLLSVALCGLVLVVAWFTYRRVTGTPMSIGSSHASAGLPYGLAIGAGALIAAL